LWVSTGGLARSQADPVVMHDDVPVSLHQIWNGGDLQAFMARCEKKGMGMDAIFELFGRLHRLTPGVKRFLA